jgi:hypothetical protein
VKLREWKAASGEVMDVHVTTGGSFQVYSHGSEKADDMIAVGDTLDQALEAAKRAAAKNKVRVSVPFITWEGHEGVAHGINARTLAVLARVNGKPQQFDGYSATHVLSADIPDKELERLQAALAAAKRAADTRMEITQKWKFDLKAAVQEAVNAATKEAS